LRRFPQGRGREFQGRPSPRIVKNWDPFPMSTSTHHLKSGYYSLSSESGKARSLRSVARTGPFSRLGDARLWRWELRDWRSYGSRTGPAARHPDIALLSGATPEEARSPRDVFDYIIFQPHLLTRWDHSKGPFSSECGQHCTSDTFSDCD